MWDATQAWPVALLLGPIELAWIAIVGPVAIAPVLLAARQWFAGGALLVVAAIVVRPALRSLHQLARRWIVFVPAGVVVHDPEPLRDQHGYGSAAGHHSEPGVFGSGVHDRAANIPRYRCDLSGDSCQSWSHRHGVGGDLKQRGMKETDP